MVARVVTACCQIFALTDRSASVTARVAEMTGPPPDGGRSTITSVTLTPSLGIVAGTRSTATGSRLDAAVTAPTAAAAATPTTARRTNTPTSLATDTGVPLPRSRG